MPNFCLKQNTATDPLKCHQCMKKRTVVPCTNCKQKMYCIQCIKQWYDILVILNFSLDMFYPFKSEIAIFNRIILADIVFIGTLT